MGKKNQIVLITGSAKRIGKGIAEYFSRQGYSLILHYFNSQLEVEILKKSLEQKHPHQSFFLLKADLSQINNEDSLTELLLFKGSPLKKNENYLVGLINNASYFKKGRLTDKEDSNLESHLFINVYAPLILSRYFYTRYTNQQKNSKNGFVINIIDAYLEPQEKNFQNYHLSKRWLRELTKETAKSFAPDIQVNAVSPGPIIPSVFDNQKRFLERVKNSPMQIAPGIEGILNSIDFFMKNRFITGQVINVDSGFHLYE